MVRRVVVVIGLLVVALCAAGVAMASYRWPVKPFGVQHPIRGFFGDPRTVFDQTFGNDGVDGAGRFSFHNGIDISAPDGTPVYPVASGIVHLLDASAVAVRTFDDRSFQYFHVVPTVIDGEHVVTGLSVLGHVQAPFEHVHLSEIDGDRITNPLVPGHLEPYRDRTKPTVTTIQLRDRTGVVDAPAPVCGSVAISAEAFDEPPLRVPGSFAGMPVAPAIVRWDLRTLNGVQLLPPQTAVDFRRTLPPPRDFWHVYARGSYQNAPRFGSQQFEKMPGRFLYRLTTLDTRQLPDGVYRLDVMAADERGNRGMISRSIWIDNADGACAASATQPGEPAG